MKIKYIHYFLRASVTWQKLAVTLVNLAIRVAVTVHIPISNYLRPTA